MLVISVQDIINYSICPNLAKYSKNNSLNFYSPKKEFNLSFNDKSNVIESIIKRIILESGYKPITWEICRRIILKISNRYLIGKNQLKSKLSEIELVSYYKQLKKIIAIVQPWYLQSFTKYNELNETTRLFINLPFKLTLNDSLTIQDMFDIISVGNLNMLCDVQKSENKYRTEMLSNDISCHIKLWCYYKIMETIPNYYERIILSKDTLYYHKIYINEEILKKTEKIVKYITRGIYEKVFYPNYSNQCKTCKYSGMCNF